MAKCPACAATFIAKDAPPEQVEQPVQPTQSTANPYSAPLQSRPNAASTNPYQPTEFSQPVKSIGSLQIVSRSFDDVVSAAFAIFGERWGQLVLAFLIVAVINIVYSIASNVVLSLLGQGGQEVALVSVIASVPLSMFVQAVVTVGLSRNAVAVVRNSGSPLNELMPPMMLVWRYFAVVMLLTLAAGLVAGLYAIIVAIVASGNNDVAGVLGLVGILILIVGSFIGSWLLWSWAFVVSDGKAGVFSSLQTAVAITLQNKLTSFLMLLVAAAIGIAGILACFIGLLVAVPLVNAVLATGYLLMTNQRIDDPRTRQYAVR
jgi:uncharacterized membrane protein